MCICVCMYVCVICIELHSTVIHLSKAHRANSKVALDVVFMFVSYNMMI